MYTSARRERSNRKRTSRKKLRSNAYRCWCPQRQQRARATLHDPCSSHSGPARTFRRPSVPDG